MSLRTAKPVGLWVRIEDDQGDVFYIAPGLVCGISQRDRDISTWTSVHLNGGDMLPIHGTTPDEVAKALMEVLRVGKMVIGGVL